MDLKNYRRSLRKNSTYAEQKLWQFLRSRKFYGVKFRRQYQIKNYIADFICIEKNLIIEIDGSQHIEQASYDIVRTEKLFKEGFQVIRFWNNDVLQRTRLVLEVIYTELIKEKLH